MKNKVLNKSSKAFKSFCAIAFLLVIIPLIACTGKNSKKEEDNLDSKRKEMITDTIKPRKIAVIGAGWLGGTVGKLLVKAGHEVMFSSRHPEELRAMAEELGKLASVGTPKEAAAFGDILLFAVPYDAIPQLGIDLKEEIKGKIVLDACNGGSGELGKEVEKNGNGPTSAKYLAGTRLVRVFSSEDATAIEASAGRKDNKLAIPVAGDDVEARELAAQLVRDAGCEPIIVGDLSTGVKFQRNTPAFRANTNVMKLSSLLGITKQ